MELLLENRIINKNAGTKSSSIFFSELNEKYTIATLCKVWYNLKCIKNMLSYLTLCQK